jgi:ABC-type transport system substrate-binding protein
VHLKQANDAFLSSCLLHASGCIVPRDAVEATEKRRIGPAPTPAAVSGRYVVDRWDRGDRIVLSCNDEWTGASPKYKTVKFVIIPDDRVAQDKVDSKEIDLMRVEPDTLNQMSPSRLAPLQVVSLPGLTVSYLALDAFDDRLKDERLRSAVRLALNVDTAVKRAYGSFARRATGLVPSAVDGARREISAGRDPREAQRLLSAAGFAGGFAMTLFVFPRSLGTEIMADSFVRDLAEIGVKLDVKFESPVEARRDRRPVPISLVRRTMVPDARVVLGSFGSADNAARFASDAARSLVRTLASATGPELVKTGQTLQDLLNRTGVIIPLAEESAVWLLQRGLQVPFTRFGELPDLGDIPPLRR